MEWCNCQWFCVTVDNIVGFIHSNISKQFCTVFVSVWEPDFLSYKQMANYNTTNK